MAHAAAEVARLEDQLRYEHDAKGWAIIVPGSIYKGLLAGSGLLPRAVKRWVYATAMKRG